MRKANEINLIFDFDGVICENNNGNYADAPPKPYSIEQINRAYDKGFNIVIFTARYGSRHPGKEYEHGYEEALKWLRDHKVKFHTLRMAKPAGDVYVDDKACLISKDEDWETNFWPKVHSLKNLNQYNQPTGASDVLIPTRPDPIVTNKTFKGTVSTKIVLGDMLPEALLIALIAGLCAWFINSIL